jgi:predicted Fe-Mo cluster-binding NifX family protein
MKVAVSSKKEGLDSTIDSRFGRCPFFTIIETDSDEIKTYESIENPGMREARGAGIVAAQAVVDKGVESVISGNVGPNSFNALSQSGIKIYSASEEMTVEEAVKRLLKGDLIEINSASV